MKESEVLEVVGSKRDEREGEVRYNNYGTRLELIKYVAKCEMLDKLDLLEVL